MKIVVNDLTIKYLENISLENWENIHATFKKLFLQN